MRIEIETYDRRVLYDLMESSSFKVGQQKKVPGGATITLGTMTLKRSAGITMVNMAVNIMTAAITSSPRYTRIILGRDQQYRSYLPSMVIAW